MMDARAIEQLSREAGQKAAREHLEPFMFWEEDRHTMPPFPFPFLGTHRAKGWRLVHRYFVDSSGFGREDEPAMTIDAFIRALKTGRGYAILQAGQFQVYVGEFVHTAEQRFRKAA